MATALSLDDLGAIGKHASKPRKKKSSIKAKSTAKVAKKVKGVKTVSGTKIVKKKKTKGMLDKDDPLAVAINAEKMYREIAAEQEARAIKEVKVKDKAKKKAAKEAGVKKIKIKKLSDVKEVPKKKKKKSSALATLPAIDERARLDKQMIEVLDAVPDAMKQENEQIVEYMTMFNKLRRMARMCEKQYFDKKQSRDVYALMKIYDQMREIIADLRALRDVGEMGEVLNSEVLGPLAQSNATVLVGFHQQINAWAKAHLPTDSIANFRDASDVIVKTLAKDMEQSYHASLDKTVAIFSQNG